MNGIDAQMAKFHAMSNRLGDMTRDSQQTDRLKEVSREFEALFIEQMLTSMRQTVHKENDILDGGMAQGIFEDMLYQEYARIMAKTGSLGLSDLVYQDLTSRGVS